MRRRDPSKLDAIADAATDEFVDRGFLRARIHHIADRARVGPGTVYLYVADKDALYELVVRRALGDPTVAFPALPFRGTWRRDRSERVAELLEPMLEFPQLWVAQQRQAIPDDAVSECEGIIREIYRWLARYRTTFLLAERNRWEWPELPALLERLVWDDLATRLADYLGRRRGADQLALGEPPDVVANAVLTALAGFAVGGAAGRPPVPESVAVSLLLGVVRPQGEGSHARPSPATIPA